MPGTPCTARFLAMAVGVLPAAAIRQTCRGAPALGTTSGMASLVGTALVLRAAR